MEMNSLVVCVCLSFVVVLGAPEPPQISYGAPEPQHISYSAPESPQVSYGAPSSGGFLEGGYIEASIGGQQHGGGGETASYGKPQEPSYPPRPYNFQYQVNDKYTGTDFERSEHSDGNVVNGQYQVQLPDGRKQIVTYTADWENGFNAQVDYQGEAQHPPPPAGGYGGQQQQHSSGGDGGYGGQQQHSTGGDVGAYSAGPAIIETHSIEGGYPHKR